MGVQSANSANSKKPRAKSPAHVLALLAHENQQPIMPTACLPACVGTANNANTVCLLHELTTVCLLHELSMGRRGGGGGPWPRANGNGGFTNKFF